MLYNLIKREVSARCAPFLRLNPNRGAVSIWRFHNDTVVRKFTLNSKLEEMKMKLPQMNQRNSDGEIIKHLEQSCS